MADAHPPNPEEFDEAVQPERWTVADADGGARLDRWLADQTDDMTRSRWKALILERRVTRDGAVVSDPSSKVRAGDTYVAARPPPSAPAPLPEAIPLHVAFEDAHLIVVDKPAGLVVHPATGHWGGTLVNALLHHCGDSLSGVGGVARPGVVHRIDKDTSGLLVVAKTDAAHRGLSALFAAHDIERTYEAIVVGAPRPGLGTIDAPLARAPNDRKKMAVAKAESAAAKRAVTHYKTLDAFGRGRAALAGDALAAHMQFQLETGRTHQIRAHCAHIGHPIMGDPLYGPRRGLRFLSSDGEDGEPELAAVAKALSGLTGQALHARVLGFEHPITGAALRLEAPPPADFLAMLKALGRL
ncbi:MAG: RluA family pseudouridine synthase [Pseudomonadota bacterium]